MKQHQTPEGKNDEWITPPEIIKALGQFDLDPCNAVNNPYPTATKSFTVNDDGLIQVWEGRVWLNPPFNKKIRPLFMKKMAEHNNGIMLIPAACETAAFQKYVLGRSSGILMLNHRPHFHYITGEKARANSGCTICLVAYGYDNLQSLIKSGLGTVFVEKNHLDDYKIYSY